MLSITLCVVLIRHFLASFSSRCVVLTTSFLSVVYKHRFHYVIFIALRRFDKVILLTSFLSAVLITSFLSIVY
jgi:hypothetical protein